MPEQFRRRASCSSFATCRSSAAARASPARQQVAEAVTSTSGLIDAYERRLASNAIRLSRKDRNVAFPPCPGHPRKE